MSSIAKGDDGGTKPPDSTSPNIATGAGKSSGGVPAVEVEEPFVWPSVAVPTGPADAPRVEPDAPGTVEWYYTEGTTEVANLPRLAASMRIAIVMISIAQLESERILWQRECEIGRMRSTASVANLAICARRY